MSIQNVFCCVLCYIRQHSKDCLPFNGFEVHKNTVATLIYSNYSYILFKSDTLRLLPVKRRSSVVIILTLAVMSC